MYRKVILWLLCMVLFSAVMAAAEDVKEEKKPKTPVVNEDKKADAQTVTVDTSSEAKELSGMSIVGNDEAPKSLYIVPWKSSELGVETSLDTMLTEGDVPVDRDVFKRLLEFYEVSTKK